MRKYLFLALTIKQAFPCLSRAGESNRGQAADIKIAQSMENSGLCLIGWYHSHPISPPTPTVQDIDTQLEHQLKLKGTGEQGYRPCVAMILCKQLFFVKIYSSCDLISVFQFFDAFFSAICSH